VAGVIWGTVIAYGVFVLVPMMFYVPGVLRRIQMHEMDPSPTPQASVLEP
jgi:hypothetical protein